MTKKYTGMEIAVIGISGRFPKSENHVELWKNLINNKECIDFYTKEELIAQGCDPNEIERSNYVLANAFVANKDKFQPEFFGYSPKEAVIMTPQLRLLHEVVWECLEDAGYNPFEYADLIGLYAGTSNSMYWESLTYLSGKSAELGEFDAEHLNNKDTSCTKIAYNLNLRGPAVAIHTECSTGLVAIHMAVKGLLTGECKMALAGGIGLSYFTKGGYLHEEGMIRSSDGHCRAFDDKSDGTMLSEGGGIVLLKRLKDAIADGDHIYATIKGSAINNDGYRKVGFTAPSVDGQVEVIKKAQKIARIHPKDICFVEAHGTGTNLGDPIEVDALKAAFGDVDRNRCALGSIKTNIGHLGEGAGVAGFIKVALSLKNRVFPASLNFETPNTKINFENSPFFVNNNAVPLQRKNETLLLGAVSSFGIGGTNVHVILEEYDEERKDKESNAYEILPFSAQNTWSLNQNIEKFKSYLTENPKYNASNIAYTLQQGRKHFPVRTFVVSDNYGKHLEEKVAKVLEHKNHVAKNADQVVFMFPGQGNQYASMAKEMYEYIGLFRSEMDTCFGLANKHVGHKFDLKRLLFTSSDIDQNINDTEITQLLLFIVEYSLANYLIQLGIQPDVLVGHSIGEYVAACLSGVFSLEDAIKTVAVRGALMQKAPKGKMLSVAVSEEKIIPLLPESLSVAVINSKNSCVVSGDENEIKQFQQELEKEGILSRILVTSHAFHSHLMDAVLDEFKTHFNSITLNTPKKEFLANSAGAYIRPEEVATSAYWVQQIRRTVRFADCIEKIDKGSLFVEVGPGRSLTTFAKQSGCKNTVTTLRHPKEEINDVAYCYNAIGTIWQYGIDVDWNQITDRMGRIKETLPTYSFKRERYWIDDDPLLLGLEAIQNKDKEEKKPVHKWFYQPSWKQKRSNLSEEVHSERIKHLLIFGTSKLFEDKEVINQIEKSEPKSVTVVFKKGEFIEDILPEGWTSIEENNNTPEFYNSFIQNLKAQQKFPSHVLHFWSINTQNKPLVYDEFIANQDSGILHLLHVAQAIRNVNIDTKVYVSIITAQQFMISGYEHLAYSQATIQAANIILPQEFHEVLPKQIDFGSIDEIRNNFNLVLKETATDYTKRTVAYRNKIRWIQSYEATDLVSKPNESILKQKGTYLITGGLGNVGSILSRHIAKNYHANIIILSRSVMPDRSEWGFYLKQDNTISKKIKRIQEIEALGGTVFTVSADVGNKEAVNRAIHEAETVFGKINGVIHAAAETNGASHVCHVDQVTKQLIVEQFYTKIKGTTVLSECFENKPIDFFTVTSSLSAVLGGIGFLAYAASNLFVDYYLAYKNQNTDTRWISVNWDGWEDEEDVDTIDKSQSYILPEEGAMAFQYIMENENQDHVVISTRDLPTKLKKWIDLKEFGSEKLEDKEESLTTIQRSGSLPEYQAPKNKTEEKLLEAWQKIFGIKNIGINDNFFELGGDSLKAVVLANRIFKELNVKVALQDLFKNTDIESLAEFIEGENTSNYKNIPLAEKKPYYKLSSPQKRFYFVYELDKESLAYNMPVGIRLKGQIDKQRFENAFKRLINRHENFRTSFKLIDGQPYQFISDTSNFTIQYIQGKEEELDNIREAFVRPFDLSKAPLFRAALLEFSANNHVLLTDIHHIINDAESSELMVKDFLSFYNNETLPELKIQFKDFAEWQQSEEQQNTIASQKEFWINEFTKETTLLEVPTDFPRPAVKSHIGNVVNFNITEEQTIAIKKLAEQEESSLFMVLLSIFNVFQSKLSNQEDVVIGTSTAGREHPDLENSIGMFVNTIPIRNYPKGDLSFKAFLEKVKHKTLACFENQSYPYEELINELKIERTTSRNPLFDVMFAFLNIEETTVKLPGLSIEPYEFGHPVSKFDYTLQAYDDGTTIFLSFEYSTDLFKEATIQRFISYFKAIVAAVVENPEINISNINILSKEETQFLVEGFNATVSPKSEKITIHELIEAQALKNPEAIALDYNGVYTTYAELNSRANQLAHYLRETHEIVSGKVVGVCADRSDATLIGILGVLKAGAAYLPIDPKLPKERIAYMLSETEATVVLTLTEICDVLNMYKGSLFLLDKQLNDLVTSIANIGLVNNPDDIAYIIYTSGSTGNPKGVAVGHSSLLNYIDWASNYYIKEDKPSTFALYTSLSFDLTITSIFTPLVTGNQIVIYGNDSHELLIEKVFSEGKATVVKLTPSHLKIVRDSNEVRTTKEPLTLIVGGEALDSSLASSIYKKLGGNVIIYNEYGPTEATVGCMIHEYNDEAAGISVPIGVPIQNTQIYLLDEHQRLVPRGVWGELYISGVCLAKGYLKNESLTEERFPKHFCKEGVRMYKTGDKAVCLEDGTILFKGRIDNQVKIRGYRIELGEIENVMEAYEKITSAAVVVKEKDEHKYLLGYYVSEEEIKEEKLKEALLKQLPEYMIPVSFIALDKMPLTINGKIDVRSLPDTDDNKKDNYKAPETKEEHALCKVWSSVLGVEKVGVSDNFFALGGDSIKSIQICARLQNLGYAFSVRDILREHTVQKQSLKLKSKVQEVDQSKVTGKVNLVPIQKWFMDGSIKKKHHFNQSIMLQFPEVLEKESVIKIFEKIQDHHDALRMVLVQDKKQWQLENKGVEVKVSLEEFQFTETPTKEEIVALSNKIQSGIDLEKGPLMKLGLFHSKEGSSLLMVIHHLVIDAVSWRILFEDIEQLYQQHKEGAVFKLPKKTDAFISWSKALERYSKTKTFEKAKTYWENQSNKMFDRLPKKEIKSNELQTTGEIAFQLNNKQTEELLTKSHQTFNTQINDLLLTAFTLSLKESFGMQRVLVEMEGHGREALEEEIDITRTIGWFTSLYPVILDVESKDIKTAIVSTKETLRAIPNHGFDYLLYQQDVETEDQLNRRAEISFNYLGQFDEDVSKTSYTIVNDERGDEIDKEEELMYDWEVSGMITGGQLHMNLLFDRKKYEEKDIAFFMKTFKQRLQELIYFCQDQQGVYLTPSDLTYKELSCEQLEELQEQYVIEDIYPLSPMQEGILFHSIFNTDATHYFEQISYRLKGSPRITALEQSLNDLMLRYSILRTIFLHEKYDRPIQVVLKERTIDFTFKDIRAELIDEETETVIRSYKNSDREKTFDISSSVLMRVNVLQIGAEEFEFIWSHHHILMDGWCMGILIQEFNKLYRKHTSGISKSLSTVQPYSNYIQWLENRETQNSEKYWTDYLNGYDEVTNIKGDYPVLPDGVSYVKASETLILSKEKTSLLHNVSKNHNVTINTIIQAAWAILLSKYNNTSDVLFGAVVSGRPAEVKGIESMVGLFINTIPVRMLYNERNTVKDFLINIQERAIESEAYHYHPLSEVQTYSSLGRKLLDHIIIFENYPISEEVMSEEAETLGFKVTNVDMYEETNYDLFIEVFMEDELTIDFNYNASVYEYETFKRVANHLHQIIAQIIESTAILVCEINVITLDEEQILLKQFNNTEKVFQDTSVVSLFETQVQKTPNNIAIRYGEQTFTYKEVDELSNKIANYLKNVASVEQGSLVGILLEREPYLIPIIMGIHKAGAAYVPIAPDYPTDRIYTILNDAEIKHLITRAAYVSELSLKDVNCINIDEKLEVINEQSIESLQSKIVGNDLAYVIYTSGSTGKPKGVMINHASIANLIQDLSEKYPLTESDVYLFKTPYIFDVSISELFGWFLNGGSLAILPIDHEKEPEKVIEAINTYKVTHSNFVPSFFNILVNYSEQHNTVLSSLKYVFVAGEAMTTSFAKKFKAKYPSCELWNLYGPTENTVYTSGYEVKGTEENTIPIGKPLSNMNILVLDQWGNLTPLGVAGELCVTGKSLAQGYLNNEELTNNSFVNASYLNGTRMYRTGDLVQWTKNGDLEFLGRIDHQVKIRGFRIELGDIEHHLLSHPKITEAVVVVRERQNEKYLMAYYLTKELINSEELTSFLFKKIPAYMVPSFYMELNEMPLTVSGKINRKELPEFEIATSEVIQPSNEVEEKLLEIWSEVLQLDKEEIGVTTSFFALGGHSLKALSLINKINKHYNIQVTLQLFFEKETIRDLADNITTILQIQYGIAEDDESIEITI